MRAEKVLFNKDLPKEMKFLDFLKLINEDLELSLDLKKVQFLFMIYEKKGTKADLS